MQTKLWPKPNLEDNTITICFFDRKRKTEVINIKTGTKAQQKGCCN